MSSVALTIESLSCYAYIVHDALGSLQTTEEAIKAHKEGKAQELRNGVYSSIPIIFKCQPFAPKETIGPELLQEGELLEEKWKVITDECLRQASREKPDFTPAGEDPASYIIRMISSEDHQKNRQAVDLYDKALTLSGRHPKALPVLEQQAVYEKAILRILAPLYEEICPTKVESPYATRFYATEPVNLDAAVKKVYNFQHWTGINLSRYKNKDEGSFYGGYGETFILMRQDGYFASLAGPWLMKEVSLLDREWREGKENFYREAVNKEGGAFCIGSPYEIIDKWAPAKQDKIARQASELQLLSSWTADHFQRQTSFGEKLMANLKARKKGEVFPNPQNFDQVKELVDISLEWTRISAITISAKDFCGWKGGFAWLYQWLAREDSGQYVRSDLLEEGRKIGQGWQKAKKDNKRLAFRQALGIDLGDIDPDEALLRIGQDHYASRFSGDLEIRAAELLFYNQEAIALLQKQALYEQKLNNYLKTA